MIKRILLYLAGTLTLGLGLVLNSKTGLGNAAITSVAFTLSSFTPLTFGQWTTVTYIIFMTVQCILMRKISLKVLMQLPFSYVFGVLLDFYSALIPISNPPLVLGLLQALLAITLTALGVVIMVAMDLIVNPADGLVAAFAAFFKVPFGKAKSVTDVCMFCTSAVLGLVFAHRIVGLGIGTVMTVLLVGNLINLFNKLFREKLLQFAFGEKH